MPENKTRQTPKAANNQPKIQRLLGPLISGIGATLTVIWSGLIWIANIILVAGHFLKNEERVLAIIVLAFAPVLVILDPLKIDEVSDRNQARIIDKIFSPFYGGKERKGQGLITVVLIDQTSLNLSETPRWPPTYRYQAKLLEALSIYEPLAIFYDFYYSVPQMPPRSDAEITAAQDALRLRMLQPWTDNAERGNETEAIHFSDCRPIGGVNGTGAADNSVLLLAETIDCLRHGHLRLPNSDAEDDGIDRQPIPIITGPVTEDEPLLEPLRAVTEEVVDNYPGQAAIRVVLDDNINYPTTTDEKLSAAFVLYEIYCRKEKEKSTEKPNDNDDANCKEGIHNEFPDSTPLNLTWGYGRLPKDEKVATTDEKNRTHGNDPEKALKGPIEFLDPCPMKFSERIHVFIGFITGELLAGISKPLKRGCHYHQAIYARDIINGPDYRNGAPLTRDDMDSFDLARSKGLSRYLKNRIILVGADIPSLADSFDTPIYEKQPGVFLHAMALDNLITNPNRVSKQPHKGIGGADVADLFALIVTMAAQVLILMFHDRLRHLPGKQAELLLIYLVVVIASGAIIFIGGYNLMHWPATNVLDSLFILLFSIVVFEWGGAHAQKPKKGQGNDRATKTV